MFSACGISSSGPVGQAAWTAPGTYSWICPEDVFEVSGVAVGGGANSGWYKEDGGGGGGLGWKNNIPTVPGQAYAVKVGGANQDSYFISLTVVKGGGAVDLNGGTFVGDGGGNGGKANIGGGGAGGYTGPGGNGGRLSKSGSGTAPTAGQGGSGGGGGSGAAGVISGTTTFESGGGAKGGGVGIMGQGADGTAGSNTGVTAGGDGSGAPAFGAGAAGAYYAKNNTTGEEYYPDQNLGFPGAVRIIWGAGRAFPSTMTGDM